MFNASVLQNELWSFQGYLVENYGMYTSTFKWVKKYKILTL